ncbi:acyl-CoA dehydrogenase family protein [Gordonia sp. ABSL11-1]|uniref:acyl-CoA dehydrogenase family protein n=1 Tax=Gordonia sp. ABSL11-1 TaxID=3053924 RepID=UPI002572C2F5|nr:acyl-CoA dehydrogenase family protein [Gordonia sp. ABSL11-1]MDL9948125.1 acyl-CoA dehydrogenase family protein [Gordonia sp. ABSL11-1]
MSELMTQVPVLHTADDAYRAADEVAAIARAGAVARDKTRQAPLSEIDAMSRSGLLGIRVPTRFGGPDLPHSVVVEITRRISVADPAFAQLYLTHWVVQERLRREPVPAVASEIYAEVLAGAHLGNANSERGTAQATAWRTSISRQDKGTYLLNGEKYYATGALGASWIAVGAVIEHDQRRRAVVFVRPDAPGVKLDLDQWSGFGQRSSHSGAVYLHDVAVRPEFVLDVSPPADGNLPPKTQGAVDQSIHAAIDVGIVRAALGDAVEFVRTRSRPKPEFDSRPVVEEELVQHTFGRHQALLHALEALLRRAAHSIDEAHSAPELTDENTAAASLAVAEAKGLANDIGIDLVSSIFDILGSSATDESLGLDRHWRNIRTHSLHDPARAKFVLTGRHLLTGERPPRHLNV